MRKSKVQALIESEIDNFKNYHLREAIEKYIKKQIIECEICKCLLFQDATINGKEIIKTRKKTYLWHTYEELYIHTPHYCKRCAPKSLKAKKEGK